MLTLPHATYRPAQRIEFDGRQWVVDAVAHTGRELTATAADTGRFRRERFAIAPAQADADVELRAERDALRAALADAVRLVHRDRKWSPGATAAARALLAGTPHEIA